MILKTLIFITLFWATATNCLAKAPAYGAKPKLERTTGYWAQVERVVDGDTFWADGVKYREAGIDTPETSDDPRHGYKCEAERRLGELAAIEAEALLGGRKVWIKPTGRHDYYGRPLVRTRITKGKWYDDHMIRARLAAPWRGRKHKWCAPVKCAPRQ